MFFKRKRYKRTLDDIGKEIYNFDLKKEKNIYNYVSCYKFTKKGKKQLDDELKFDSYGKWKNYIVTKYSECKSCQLEEFSRYLNQRIRNAKVNHTYWGMVIPIMLTIVTTRVLEVILNVNFNLLEGDDLLIKIILYIVFMLIISIVILIPGFLMIKEIVEPIFDNDMEKNLFEDYKEIIDDMMKSESLVEK